MSRAFVRESDVPQLPDLPPQSSPLPPGAKNYVTPSGAEQLRLELAELRDKQRPALAAAPVDDLDAKRDLQMLDRRIRYLQERLRAAEIVGPTDGPTDLVRFGATVTVREENGTEARYRIVGVGEADAARDWISWLSPLARALMNARVGQTVSFATPRGPKQLEIRAISYAP